MAAEGLHQMDVGCMVLTETKLTNDQYPKFILGYQVILSKVESPHLGGGYPAVERIGGSGLFD